MAVPSSSAAASIPDKIGRYRIVRPLSKGGMALVFEARRESLAGVSPRVAIKVILPDYATSTTFRDLFINEARLGAAMHHQNLVQIQDFDSDGDRYFLVMEYVEGLTLSRLIGLAARHNIPVPMGVICEIGRQACDGLHYAHQAVDSDGRPLSLVHRDIKPSNLIVTPQGSVKILDFGISKGTLRMERSGSVKGTWGYMSPEQASGDRVGPTADIFGLGIVLYEMAARRSMFKGRKEEEIRSMLEDDHAARMVAAIDSSYAPVSHVLSRSLQKDRRKRFATAADFGRALSELLPDPITARDQTIRFYEQVLALNEAEKAGRAARPAAAGAAPSQQRTMGSMSAAVTNVPSPALRVFSITAGALAVIAAFLLGYTIYEATEPAPPASAVQAPTPEALPRVEAAPTPTPEPVEVIPPAPVDEVPAERPLPVRSVGRGAGQETEVADPPARVVIKPRETPAKIPGDKVRIAPIETGPEATLVLGTVQEAEIYLDGQLLREPHNEPV